MSTRNLILAQAFAKKPTKRKHSSIEPLESRIAPAAAVGLSVTKVAVFAPGGDVNGDGFFQPGDTILYTVTITNNGTVDLTNVTFNDVLDGNSTLGSVNVSPLALDDTFSAVANTLLEVGVTHGAFPAAQVAGGLFANDSEFLGDTFALKTFEAASANSGTVSVDAAGHFTYLPAVGFSGVDTFHYTITDKGIDGVAGNADDLTSVGTATITVGAQKVWYVDNSYAGTNGASDGRSMRPFTSITATNLSGPGGVGDVDGVGDILYVHTGTGAAYTGGIALESTQTLHGQGTALVVSGFTLQASGTAPTLSNVGGTVVALSTNNTLKGFTLGDSNIDLSGTAYGTATLSDLTFNGTGQILALANGTLAATSNISLSTTSTTLTAVVLSNTAGSLTAGGAISGANGGIAINDSTLSVTYSGNVTNTGPNPLLSVVNHTTGALTFNTGTLTATGTIFTFSNADGTYNFNGTNTITNGQISVFGGSSGTFGFSSNSSINNTTNGLTAFDVNGSNAIVTYPGTVTSTTNTFLVDIASNTGGSVALSGNLSGTSLSNGIHLQQNSGGTFTFSGTAKTLNTSADNAVSLVTNLGATINFTGGGLGITTTSGTGFSATGGGTISVQGAGNTIAATSGSGLIVANTTISASALTFQSIASGAGANVGISLDTTGASGGLTVTGTGSANSGGIISGKTGADGSATSGIGVYLNSTRSVSLTRVDIEGNQNYGIRGNNVTGFTLDNSTVGTTSANGTSNTADTDAAGFQGEGSVRFFNLLGTATISNSTLDNGFSRTVAVANNTGTLTSLTITNSTLRNSLTAATASDALYLEAEGATTTVNLIVTGASQFTSARQNLIQTNAQLGATMNIAVDGSTFKNTNTNTVSASNLLVFNGTGTNTFVTFDLHNNTFTQGNGVAAAPSNVGRILTAGMVNGAGTFYGKIVNNTFGTSGVAFSGGGNGADTLGLFADGNNGSLGGTRYLVQGNTIQNYGQSGIQIGAVDGNATIDATVLGNIIRQPGTAAAGAFAGIWAYAGNLATDTNVLNIVIGSASVAANKNTLTNSDPNNSFDVFLGNVGVATAPINLSRNGSGAGAVTPATEAQVNTVLVADNVGPLDLITNTVSPINLVTTLPSQPPLFFAPSAGDQIITPVTPIAPIAPIVPVVPVMLPPGESVVVVPPVVQPPVLVDDGILSQAELDSLVGAAIARWEATGLTPAQSALLHHVTFSVQDLPGWYLGEATSGHVVLDSNAAGNAWFIDATPNDDSEFAGAGTKLAATASGGAAGRVDALTTIVHELGHQLGLEDTYTSADATNIMYGFIGQGERRLASAHQADGAVPHLAGGTDFAFAPITVGSLPVGKSVTVKFNALINVNNTAATITNQGTASSTETGAVLSDDPAVAGAANPTVTTVTFPSVTVAALPASVNEDGSGTITYTFTRQTPTTNALTVNFSTSGTASAANDFTLASGTGTVAFNSGTGIGTVTFAAGSATATVVMSATDDTTVEADETVALTVTSGTTGYAVGSPAAATGTILNDDTDVSVAVSPGSVSEDGAGNLLYTFTRTGVTAGALTVNFSVGGAATFGTDYVQSGAATFGASSGTVTFAAGAPTAVVTLDPTVDNVVESDETAVLTVTSGTGYSPAGTGATGTITNDDATVSVAVSPTSVAEDGVPNLIYTFTRTGFTTNALTVDFTVGGTAAFSTDYTQSGAAIFAAAAGTVTFGAGVSTATVTIDPTADATAEPDETVSLALAASGAGYTSTAPTAATGTILNDDTIVTLALTPGATTSEATLAPLTYTFTRTGDTSTALTVNFTTGGSATLTNDYALAGTASVSTITIPAGSASAAMTFTPVNDAAVEGSETAAFTLAAGAGYGVGTAGAVTATITDNDTATIGYSAATSSIGEGGGNDALGLVLTITANGTGTPTLARDVTFNVTTVGGTATGGGTDYTLPALVTFASGALSGATQTANLAIVNDAFVEGTEAASLSLSLGTDNTGGQVTIASGAAANHATTITDNDTATIGFSTATSTVGEGAVNDALGLVLTITANGTGTATLARDVTFNVNSVAGGTATGGGTDYTLPALATFSAGALSGATQTANLAIVNDALVEGSETATLTVALGADGTGGQVTIASGAAALHTTTITDNDTATIGYAAATSTVNEGAANDPLSLVLTIIANGTGTPTLSRNVTLNVTTAAGGTATDGADYSLPALVTFTSGALNGATRTANLLILGDALVEGNETANLALAIATDNTGGQVSIAAGAAASHIATITDNDADLAITKTNGTATTIPGASTTYTIVVSNPGLTGVTGATISDVFPASISGATFTAVGAGGASSFSASGSGNLAQTVNLPSGSSITYTVTGTVNQAATGTLSNTATVAVPAAFVERVPANNTATDSDTLTPQGDLSITKTDGKTTQIPGTSDTYTIVVSNSGPSTVVGATIADTFPASFSNITFTAVGAGGASAFAASGSGNLNTTATLPSGASVTYTVTGTVAASATGTLSNTATITAPGTFTDTTPGNNSATDSDTLTPRADVSIVKTGPSSIVAGTDITYFFTVANNGPSDAQNVNLSDTLPSNTTFVSFVQNSGPTTGGALPAGGTETFTLIAHVNPNTTAGTVLTNTANVSTTTTDLTPGNNSSTVTTSVGTQADLSVTNNDAPDPVFVGNQLTYTIAFMNNGASDAQGVSLSDVLPAGTTFVSATAPGGWTSTTPAVGGTGTVSFTKATTTASEAGTFTIVVAASASAAGATLSNTATVSSSTTDPTPGNNSATTTTIVGGVDLVLTNSDSNTTIAPGGTVTYALGYTNSGFTTATGVVLTETLPAGMNFLAADNTGWTQVGATNQYTFAVGSVATGASGSVNFITHVVAVAPAGLGTIANTASIADDSTHGTDITPGNNAATDTDTLNAAPDFTLTLTDDKAIVPHGGSVAYTISYANVGNQNATGVFLTETLPANASFDSFSSTAGWVPSMIPNTYTLALGALAGGGASGSAVFAVKLNTTFPASYTQLATTGSISDDTTNGADATPANNTDTETTPIYRGIYVVSPGIALPRKFAPPNIRVFDPATGTELFNFAAYEPTYRDSIRVAVGDMNGDGFDDIITTTAKGTGRLRIFDGRDGTQITNTAFGSEFAVFDGKKDKGAFVTAGDVNGDGFDDIIVGSARGGGKVRIFEPQFGKQLSGSNLAAGGSVPNSLITIESLPFGTKFKGGVRVAVGDVNGDGKDDLIVGQGTRGAGVKVFSGDSTTVLHDFKIGKTSYKGGVSVAAGDLDGDGKADLIIGRNTGKPTLIETFSGLTHTALGSPILPFDLNPAKPKYTHGVRVAAIDVNADGIADIIAASGGKGGSAVKIFDGATHSELSAIAAYPLYPNSALFVAGSSTVPSVRILF